MINLPVLETMADTLAHRGPDGEGFWINEKRNAGLAHRRLAIIDLSDAGAQPMHFANRYSIVYNGEIYNYIELRKELKKSRYHFVSNSDTEVILAALRLLQREMRAVFRRYVCFCYLGRREQTLFAARDRFGEKPFYYCYEKKPLCFRK